MLRAVVGHSDDVDANDAAREVIEACEEGLAGASPCAAIVFAGSTTEPEVMLAALAARYPGLPVIGATAMAELSSRKAHAESSFAVMMLASDTVVAAAGFAVGADADPAGAARAAVEMAKKRLGVEPRLCLAVSSAVRVNISQVLEALSATLGPSVPVFGGASASEFTADLDVRELFGTSVLRDAVSVLLLGGPVRVACGMKHGWTPIGAAHIATRTEGNLVIEIDGRPAMDVYAQYLGAPALAGAMFIHHPLAVFEGDEGDFYLRAGFEEGRIPGSIVMAGNVPEGATVRLTEYQREHVVEAAAAAAGEASRVFAEGGKGEPAAALVFTCCTRKTVLGTWTPREVEALRATLPAATPVAGFYAFSELAPFTTGKPSRVHNASFVTLLLGEA